MALLLRFGPGFHATAAIDRAEPHRGRRGGRGADSAACGARGVGGDTAVDQSQQGHGPHGGGAAGAALSQGDGRWWAIPLGVVTGATIGCDLDGG